MDHFETLHTCCGDIEDVHVNFCRRKNNFWQNYGILDLDNFQVRLQYWVASLCNQLLQSFQVINLKLCTDFISILKMCM